MEMQIEESIMRMSLKPKAGGWYTGSRKFDRLEAKVLLLAGAPALVVAFFDPDEGPRPLWWNAALAVAAVWFLVIFGWSLVVIWRAVMRFAKRYDRIRDERKARGEEGTGA